MYPDSHWKEYFVNLDLDKYNDLGPIGPNHQGNLSSIIHALVIHTLDFKPIVSVIANKIVAFKCQHDGNYFYITLSILNYGQYEVSVLNLPGTPNGILQTVTSFKSVVDTVWDLIRNSSETQLKGIPLILNPLKGDVSKTSTFISLN